MNVSPMHKALVQDTFGRLAVRSEAVAVTFYTRLFEINPSLRALFTHDMQQQGTKLMQLIAVAVSGLDQLDTLVPALQALGQRHVTYHVKKDDYVTVGEALLWTLQQELGDEFNANVKEAWATVYQILSDIMTTTSQTDEQHLSLIAE